MTISAEQIFFNFASVRLYHSFYRWAGNDRVLYDSPAGFEFAAMQLAQNPARNMGIKSYAELLTICGIMHWVEYGPLKVSNSRRKQLIKGWAYYLYYTSRSYEDFYNKPEKVSEYIDHCIRKWF